MRENAIIALTALGAVGTWVGVLANVDMGAGLVPTAVLAAVSVMLGAFFGWLARGRVVVPERETPHNKLCREVLAKLGELPKDERFPYIAKQVEHEKVDGRTDFSNAIRSLIEQDCIRDIEIRDYMDGGYNVHAGPHLGVTGKRYVDD